MRRSLLGVGVGLLVLSAVVLAGRLSGRADWATLGLSGAPMAFGTAIGLAFAGAALMAFRAERPLIGRVLGAGVLAIGAGALLLQYLGSRFGWATFSYDPNKFDSPVLFDGRVSPPSACALVLLGAGLWLMASARRWTKTLSVLGAGLVTIGTMGLSNYLVGLDVSGAWWKFTGMALPTATAFAIIGGILIFWSVRKAQEGRPSLGHSLPLFVLAGGLIIVAGVTNYLSGAQLVETSRLVVRAHEVRGAIDRLVAEVARMESAARGYALTGVDGFRRRVSDHRLEVEEGARELGPLTEENADQRPRIARLQVLAAEKITLANEMVRVRMERGHAAAQEFLALQPQTSSAALVTLADEIRMVETQRLAGREKEWQQTRHAAELVQTTAGGFAFVLVSVAFMLATRASVARGRAEQDLRELNERLEQRVRERTEELERALVVVTERERSRQFLADAIPQLIWTTHADGSSESVNRGYCEFTGISAEETSEMRWLEIVHPDDRVATQRLWKTIHASGREGGGEYRLRRASDGEFRWMSWLARPEHDTAGNIVRWVGATTDVHDFKTAAEQLEQKVRERTERLAEVMRLQRAVLDGNTFSIIATNRAGLIEIFNHGAEQMLGYTAEEMVNRSTPLPLHLPAEVTARAAELSVQMGCEIQAGFEAFIARALVGEPDEREWTYVRKDGSRVPVRLSVTALHDEAGEITGFVGIAQDLTQRKKAELALQASEMRLLEVIGQADCLLWEAQVRFTPTDWDWHFIVQPSAMYRRLFGEEPGTGDSGLWYRFNIPEQPEMNARCRRAIESGAPGYEQEFRVRHEGREVWLHESVSIKQPEPGLCWLVGVVTDITERKRLEFEMRGARDLALEASRLKSEFLANMSHEIRTPMNGVIGMTELLIETKLTGEQKEMAQVVRRSAESLLTIINDILDFSKIEAGKLEIEDSEFELRSLIDSTLSLFRPRFAAKSLHFESDFALDLPHWVRGDPVRIRQVLTNLVGNAVKFTDRGGVRVAWSFGKHGRLRCEVHDTGVGIAHEQQSKLFQAFVQVDGSSTRRHGGTGLGLAISRQLVELMGGELGFASELGRGSLFWFELELPAVAPATGPAGGGTAADRAEHATRPLHFLVVEDSETNQIVVQSLLELIGHTCEIAANGEEGLARLAAGEFDAVLMDCQMPVKDGFTVTREIRAGAVPGKERIPIIALTAYAMPLDRERCLAAGMNAHLAKPLNSEQLRVGIEQCLFPRAQTSAPVPRTSDETVLDPAQIEQLRAIPGRKRASLVSELAELLLAAAPETLNALRRAIAENQCRQVQQEAHRLAGSCAHLGALRMRQLALELEKIAQEGDTTRLPTTFARLENEWTRVHAALKQLSQ